MNAYGIYGPMSGLPDPDLDRQFYAGVRVRRFVAWVADLVLVMLVGVPLAVAFGLLTLGFGFALFPLVLGGVGFLYRLATIGGASATWGMRFAGIEYRRGDGTRFDPTTTLVHTALYALCIAVPFLQLLSCLTVLFTRYRQGVPDLVVGTTAIVRPVD
ncbi:MAG: RDD family protein [Amaricoccus sp.]